MLTETVTWVHHWSERTFSFKCTRSNNLKFTAGQFVLIGMVIDDAVIVRPYSIASAPDADQLEFLSVVVADGELTSQLCKIKPGSEIVMYAKTTGTLVQASLTASSTLWLLATGTGLAPFMSLVRDANVVQAWPTIHVVHSVREAQDLAYHDLLVDRQPHLHYHPIVTGQGQARISPHSLLQLGINTNLDRIMICGSIGFNQDLTAWCLQQGMIEGSVRQPGTFVTEKAFVERNTR